MTAAVRPTILVVDDTPENLKLMNGVLRDDYHVKVANGAEKALAIAGSETPPDLILLDIMMPGIDGYEACRLLKQGERTRDIPIIFLTAMTDEANEERGLTLGAVDYITKPVSPPIVLARVATQIALQNALRQARLSNRRAEELLNCVLPTVAADEIRATGTVLARRHDDVAVLFCDVVGFTSYCDSHQPEEVVRHLDALFGLFEQEVTHRGMEKIKTVGDAFMASAGLLQTVEDPLATAVACGLKLASMATGDWNLRVGVHCGPVVAGIVGQSRFQFDIWGDTVNVAARMTGAGSPGTVAVTEETWLKIADRFEGKSLGLMPVKGKGSINVVEILAEK